MNGHDSPELIDISWLPKMKQEVIDLRKQLARANAEIASVRDALGEDGKNGFGDDMAVAIESMRAQKESVESQLVRANAEIQRRRADREDDKRTWVLQTEEITRLKAEMQHFNALQGRCFDAEASLVVAREPLKVFVAAFDAYDASTDEDFSHDAPLIMAMRDLVAAWKGTRP